MILGGLCFTLLSVAFVDTLFRLSGWVGLKMLLPGLKRNWVKY